MPRVHPARGDAVSSKRCEFCNGKGERTTWSSAAADYVTHVCVCCLGDGKIPVDQQQFEPAVKFELRTRPKGQRELF